MWCSSCYAELPSDIETCVACGAVSAADCPVCGSVNRLEANFCSACGVSLAGEGATAPPAGRGGAVAAERRQLTIMICDIVGSTSLASQLDPEDLRELLGACFRCVGEAVARLGGVVARFMGDAALVYFGYPIALENAAERAIHAALDIADAVRRLPPVDGQRMSIRVGIATGLVVVGDTGRTGLRALDQDVVGLTPNLAARLQAIAGPGEVVIAATTHRLAGGLFEYRDLGPVALKGFERPVSAWLVLRPRAVESRFDAQHEAGFSPLVGREEELTLLLRRWQQVQSGSGRAVLIRGEPGIGKSRIRRALEERLVDEHHIRLSFYCSPQHVDSSLYPFIKRLEQWAGFAPPDTPEGKRAKLEALYARVDADPQDIGLIAELLSLPAGREELGELNPEQRKEKTLQAIIAPLAYWSSRGPVLVVVEDVHWIDPSSLELLGLLLESAARLRMLLIVTARPEFSLPWPSRAHVTSFTLNRLDRSDAAALVRDTARDKHLPEPVLEQILARADGVPLFIEELTKAVIESDAMREWQGVAPIAPRGVPMMAIPATLQDSLMARLHRSGGVCEVAQIGAVIGREFSLDLLRAALRLPSGVIDAAVEQLVQSELLSRRGEAADASYVFKHALIRDAAYSTLLRNQRQELHARIATVLEDRFPSLAEQQPELLGHHCTEAGLIERAIGYWGKAGRKSAARHAKVEAVVHFRRALDLLATLPRSGARLRQELELESALGRALIAAKNAAEEAGESYARARKLCEELGDDTALVPVLGGLVMYHLARCELDLARRTAEDLLRLGERRRDAAASLAGHLFGGICAFWVGELARAREQLERVLRFPVREGDRSSAAVAAWDMRIVAHCFLSLTLLLLGFPEQALASSRQALAQSRELRPPQVLVRELFYAGLFGLLRRDEDDALALAEEAISLASEGHYPFWLQVARIVRGFALAARGDTADGLALARQAAIDRASTGSLGGQTYFLGLLAQLYERTRQRQEAWDALCAALEMVERTGERWFEPELYRMRGEWLIGQQREAQAEAEAWLRKALAIARQRGAKLWELHAAMSLSRLWLAQGRSLDARELLAPVCASFCEGRSAPDLVEAQALLDEITRAAPDEAAGDRYAWRSAMEG
jgi:class 3 adenylate cyclase/predicted ATPase